MSSPNPPPDLSEVQRWFQAVITHPSGVARGAAAHSADGSAGTPLQIADRITASSKLDAESRLSVYADAYYARLLECLGDVYPILVRTVGEDVFHELAFDYLQSHPSRRYTLNVLGQEFPGFLARERPPKDNTCELDWADFVIDLARFEWALFEVFDGPGPEDLPHLDLSQYAGNPDTFAASRLILAPGMQLFEAAFPVSDHFNAVRSAPTDPQPEWDLPAPVPTYLALSRRDYVVRRHPLSVGEHAALSRLQSGATISDSLEAALAIEPVAPAQIQAWFSRWAREGFFIAVEEGTEIG
ncbi:MAG: putative DNA-binding domain-containing protein [Verrucomicrobia bacterium]|nr:putative DNA-binding domain-containing protein [Verrucomicrobiota bacterium]